LTAWELFGYATAVVGAAGVGAVILFLISGKK